VKRIDFEERQALVRDIYDAALDPELWSPVCSRIAQGIGADGSHLMAVDAQSGMDLINFLDGQDPAAHREYIEDYLPSDVRIPRLATARVGAVIRSDEVWTAEEKYGSNLYHDYQRKHKLYQITGANLGLEGKLTWFGVSREVDEPFDADGEDLLCHLVPHLRQALRISFQISTLRLQQQVLGGLWSANDQGLVVLLPNGTLVFANEEAERRARQGQIRLTGNCLRFSQTALNEKLSASLAALREGRPVPPTTAAGLATTMDGEQTGIRFHFVPAAPFADARVVWALAVLMIPLSRQMPASDAEIDQFGSLFMLTGGERRVLAAVVAGTKLSSYARGRGVSPDTARKQLKSVLGKTSCRDQKELVRLVERFCFLQIR
jgi:DNA-binding CsgD family transcriptional regulator